MNKGKLTLDYHSKVWWVSVVSIILVLIQQVLKIFGVDMPAGLDTEIMNVVNSLLALGGLMGIIYDTSNGGKNEKESN
ncbi:phage holin [Companilactobacillus sp.]|jgi:phi LC3 family holin|uniref:phage holin n=1 Tax=Companilactobacillus sp. TaxID=2767905 RepID=UPI0025C469B6|nr:phage holin [Companilactobacillus sp.]MCH4008156.1 phage holin family protein [Companilactobacillus sp.]MCH4051665.1 phage holin family protein [Companilactobacillus sp.]MCH4076099.1 phage holin family protein [Companilactobacillus sp.]MCH4124674.1 phage holin family protein [Companilactobacillus sp.]MCH4149653.1 phage holin family protein [Companilactobacillus sp.]